MSDEKCYSEEDFHRKLAADCFNRTWELLDMSERTVEQDDEMLFTTHASRFHWSKIGKPVHFERGDWQISRVNSVLNRPVAALYHARRCLDICLENDIKDFDIAFAYEAMARAHAIAENVEERDKYIALAKDAASGIAKDEDKDYFLSELKNIPGYKE